jgi:hypothetical protein
VARLNDSRLQLREGVGLFIYFIIESCSRYGLGSDSLVCQSLNNSVVVKMLLATKMFVSATRRQMRNIFVALGVLTTFYPIIESNTQQSGLSTKT